MICIFKGRRAIDGVKPGKDRDAVKAQKLKYTFSKRVRDTNGQITSNLGNFGGGEGSEPITARVDKFEKRYRRSGS